MPLPKGEGEMRRLSQREGEMDLPLPLRKGEGEQGVGLSIPARLDRLPLGRFHWTLMATTGVAWLFSSFNVAIVSFVLPVIIALWSLDPTRAGFIGSAQMLGMLVGSVGIGSLADRFGRKMALEITLLTFGLATALGALVNDYAAFTALRFVAGIGLGGMFPTVTTLISELSPSRRRGVLMVIMDGFWSFGLLFAATVSYTMIPTVGWQAAYAVGALPVLYGVFFWLVIPESPRFLVERGRGAEAEEMLLRIEAGYSRELPPVVENSVSHPRGAVRARFGDLWTGEFRRRTISIWTINFCLVFTYYGIYIWLPALLVAAGYPVEQVLLLMVYLSLAQFPGKALAALLVESVGRKMIIVTFGLLYGVSAVFLGQAGDANAILFWGCGLSFVNAVIWGPVMTYTAESYPTRARSTGAGAASAFSRIGGILGPVFTGFLLRLLHGDQSLIFVLFAATMVISALTVAFLGEETKGRSLEDIAT